MKISILGETRRKLIQVICAVLYNCNFKGFANGTIYQGSVKGVCVPGLNCYSCPGAVGACPLGSFQTGVMLLLGVVFGRVICGFLCPFGLVQELLYKLPTKKAGKSQWTRRLSLLKYVILVLFVIVIPLTYAVPGFCKYICPVGTLEGGLFFVTVDSQIRALAGKLFLWKTGVLAVILISSVFLFRSFCRFLCPLGAFYSLFHKTAIMNIQVDQEKCTGCSICVTTCKLDVKRVGDRECVQCGACIGKCPTCALGRRVSSH